MPDHIDTPGDDGPRPPMRLHDQPDEVYDSLADLFLGEQRPAGDAPAADPGELAPIEGLVLGHLPVLASAWVGQYARHSAQSEDAPVALARLYAGRLTIELFGADLPVGLVRSDDARDAIAVAGGLAARWLVRLDDPAEPAMAEPGAVDELTLLTGSDEAAMVASYRTLKSLAPGGDPAETTGPTLRVAMLNTPDGQVRHEALRRITHAAEVFLGRSVVWTGFGGRIGRGPSQVLFDGAHEIRAVELLGLVRATRGRRTIAHAHHTENAQPQALTLEEEIAVDLGAGFESVERVAAGSESTHPARFGSCVEREVLDPPVLELIDDACAVDGVVEADPPAATLVELLDQDLVPAPARCPCAAQVEFGMDDRGQLHLALEARAENVADALESLVTARAWAIEHAELLRLTPGLRDSGDDDAPTLHLATDEPKRVRGMLESEVRLHLLKRVTTAGGESATVCVELN